MLQTTEFIYQPNFYCLCSTPDPSLADTVNIPNSLFPAIRYPLLKSIINIINRFLNKLFFILTQRTVNCPGIGIWTCFYSVKCYSQFVFEEFLHVWNNTKHSNGTSNCCRAGKNAVSGTGNIISTGSSYISKAYNNGFFFFRKGKLTPNCFTGQCTAAATVYPENNCFNIFIKPCFSDQV